MEARRRTGMSEDTQVLIVEDVNEDDAAEDTPVVSKVQKARTSPATEPRIDEEDHPLAKQQPPRPIRMTPRCKYIATVVFVSVLGVIMVVTVATTLGLWSERPKETCADVDELEYTNVLFQPDKGQVHVIIVQALYKMQYIAKFNSGVHILLVVHSYYLSHVSPTTSCTAQL